VKQITESLDVFAPPEAVFRIFNTPKAFVACRPGITRLTQLTGQHWKAGVAFDVRGEFNEEHYGARGRVTMLSPPCNFGFLIPEGLGPLQNYQETYRMTFAGDSFTLMVIAQYHLPRGLKVGLMDRFVFQNLLQNELREVLANVAAMARRQAKQQRSRKDTDQGAPDADAQASAAPEP